MRSIELILLILLCTYCDRQSLNTIENIKTARDAEYFIFQHLDWEQEDHFLPRNGQLVDILRCEELKSFSSWDIADISDDGFEDLIANISDDDRIFPLVILGSNSNDFELHSFWHESVDACQLISVRDGLWKHELVFSREKPFYVDNDFTTKIVSSTLSYNYGGLIEACVPNQELSVEKITFSTDMCFGTCPVFKVSIDKSNKAVLNAQKFNEDLNGIYYTQLNRKLYDELIGLINCLNIQSLDDNYAVNWTDDQTSILEVRFRGGDSKKIVDYGLQGTLGLKLLYSKLFDLRYSQEWKKLIIMVNYNS
ncbi:MAG: DUF6438 domain-containing protein [Bacteroidota bacterium]